VQRAACYYAHVAGAHLLFGNKAGVGNAWYSDAVVKSDEIVAVAVEQLGLEPFPKP